MSVIVTHSTAYHERKAPVSLVIIKSTRIGETDDFFPSLNVLLFKTDYPGVELPN